MSDARPLLVLGTTAFAAEIADVCAAAGFEVAGFVDNLDPERAAAPHVGLPVHWIDDAESLAASHVAVCGLGTTKRTVFVEQAAARGFDFATVVHPTAHVSATSTVGEGSVLGAGVAVAGYTEIGRHVLVNRGSLVGHHTTIGDFASLQSGANVAGSCRVGEGAYIAMSAVVIDHIEIGAGALVGAGAVVVKDVAASVQVVGVPARVAKTDIERR